MRGSNPRPHIYILLEVCPKGNSRHDGEEMTKEETQRACMRIGDNIDRYLKRAGMTQRMLAAYADITEVSISRYISGDRAPRATVLYKISKVLNCTMEDLMYGVFD